MNKTITLLTLGIMTIGIAATADAQQPNRCAELDYFGYPAHCSPIGENEASYWADTACCDDRGCVEPENKDCPTQTEAYYCKYAELYADGRLDCQFIVPYFCDDHQCPPGPAGNGYEAPPQPQTICCYEEGCYPPAGDICGGLLYSCYYGASNMDGTVDCFDPWFPW